MVDVAAAAGVPVETLRKIETGRIATPAFFTVAALARALDIGIDTLAADLLVVPEPTEVAATA